MKDKRESKALSEREIDKVVVAQANDYSAWSKPTRVRRTKSASVSLPAELAARATFFARLHRQASVDEWLRYVIQERIDLEEAAFAVVKRNLAAANGD